MIQHMRKAAAGAVEVEIVEVVVGRDNHMQI